MRVMSDAAEQRVCEEDFGSEEGEEADVESYLEDNSSELVDRLRELEAENSALMLANESQREAYERCLDEVANHVVQALLNQKDLREECIKLKMLVYDLERQNRALCELFQQKLPNHPTTHYQVQTGPLPDLSPQQQSSSKQEAAPTESQAKGNGYRSQHASPARGPPTSMEALSPFFKKKAHILEVLRKMEETDPLKFHPSAPGLPFCDYSQVLMSTEAVLASADPLSLQHKPLHPHCRCPPRPDPSPAQDQCCPHARSPDAPPKPCGHLCNANANANASAKTGAQSQGGAAAAGGAIEGGAKGRAERGERGDGKQQSGKSELQQLQTTGGAAGVQQATTTGEERTQPGQDPDRGASCSDDLTGFPPSLHLNESAHSSNFDPETSEDVNIPERDSGGDPEAPLVRAGASVSPSPSCLSDVKSAAINSPSKLLKFLKIPSITEKSQANPNSSAVRLSPQLTRNSRIPCRTNNYEVYHSPVPTRRATTTERCRQPPPPPSRSESYPATHSAPTSPPQSEDVLPEKDYASSKASQAKTGAPSSSATPSNAATATSSSSAAAATSSKVTQPVPHYENVAELKASQDNDDFEKRLQAKTNAGERKLVKSLPESVLNERKQSSSSTTESTSDDEEDSDSPVWVNHHNVPVCQPAVNKAQAAKEVPVGLIPIPVVVGVQPPAPARRTESSSIPKRPGMGAVRPQGDPSHHAFKERLAALGKLRSSDDLQVGLRQVQSASGGDLEEKSNRTVDRQLMEMQKEDLRFLKYAETTEGKPKVSERKYSTQMFEQGAKAQHLSAGKQEAGKSDVSKSKIGLPSPITDAPQVLRNNIKCPGSLNLAYNVKPQSTNSPNKIPPKSPSKPCPASAQRVSKPPDAPRYSSKSEERAKMGGKAKKTPMFGDSLPPPPPKPPVTPDSQAEKIPIPIQTQPAATSPQSAIEQKVMKGIEENMLKELKEQDKVGQVTEVKQKASNGIASWFGLKKSKLPALSRKTDPAKGKDEKREWKINIPSVGRDSVKVASRCKEGVEGLNISTLMEKAEGLRRALEEERQFVERQGRGHSCEVVMDQSQGQLAVMYRGGRGDNFMQQLLNRVDGKEVICLPQRRLSFDCKTSKPVFHTDILSHTTSRDDMEKAAERIANVTSDENLADSVQHFAAGSGASTYTLDSGIGTFPLPECSSGPVGRGLSKARVENHHASSGSPGRAGRRSRTLEREMPSGEEVYNPHRQLIPTLQYSNIQETRGTGLIREDKEGASMFSPRTKTWTFPNLKAPAGPAEVYLAVEEEEEPLPYSAPYRASVKASVPPSSSSRGVVDQGSLPVPAQAGLGRRGKSRAPSVPEMSRADPALDPLSPSRPQALETPESLSDSLYDSLSSCGSQG